MLQTTVLRHNSKSVILVAGVEFLPNARRAEKKKKKVDNFLPENFFPARIRANIVRSGHI